MIAQKQSLHVDSGIKYLSQWKNDNESFINWILKQVQVESSFEDSWMAVET